MKESGCERRKLGSWRPRDDEVDERDYFVDVSAMIQGYVAGAKGLAGKDSSASSLSPQFCFIFDCSWTLEKIFSCKISFVLHEI